MMGAPDFQTLAAQDAIVGTVSGVPAATFATYARLVLYYA
jgi:hypothetical protein